MKALLDTHAFLWFVWKHTRLSAPARALILDPKNVLYLSMASCWEIAVKVSIGKLTLAEPFAVFVPREITANRLLLLLHRTVLASEGQGRVNHEWHTR